MKALAKFYFILVVSAFLAAPSLGAMSDDDQKIDSLQFHDLERASSKVASSAEYQQGMIVIRGIIKDRLLGNIWKETQKNPELMLGAMPAKELFEKFDNFNLFQNETSKILQADPERKSDFYVLSQLWGTVNLNGVQKGNNKGMILIPLHIFLGSAGWEDENYKLSLALILYNESLIPENKDTLRNLNFDKIFPQTKKDLDRKKLTPSESQTKDSGGFTGVGGGGDDVAISTKAAMINHIYDIRQILPLPKKCFDRWSDPNQLLLDILDVEIESRENAKTALKEMTSTGQVRIILPRLANHSDLGTKILAKLSLIHLCEIQAVK